MKKLIILLTLIALTSCQKEEAIINEDNNNNNNNLSNDSSNNSNNQIINHTVKIKTNVPNYGNNYSFFLSGDMELVNNSFTFYNYLTFEGSTGDELFIEVYFYGFLNDGEFHPNLTITVEVDGTQTDFIQGSQTSVSMTIKI